MKLPLRELLACIDREAPDGWGDLPISGVGYLPEELGPGTIGVGIRDWHGDYHEGVCSSLASVVVVDRDNGLDGKAVIRVDNANVALSKLCARLVDWPERSFPVIGVTGTNGKTTIVTWVEHALSALGWKVGRMGTLGASIAGVPQELSRTTPNPPELYSLMAKMRDCGCDAAVMEVGSFGLRAHRVDDLGLHLGVFTNLTQDHLDVHGSMEVYGKAKARLYECLRPAGGMPRALLCADDPYWKKMNPPPDRWTYGFAPGSDLHISNVRLGIRGSTAKLDTPFGSTELSCALPGAYNLQNMAAAIGILLSLGIPLEPASREVQHAPAPTGRTSFVENDLGLNLVIDYAHNPDGLESVLKALRVGTKGELWVLFGCGGGRDKEKRHKMGLVAESFADKVLLTSDNARHERPEAIIEDILSGMKSPPAHIETDRASAIAWVVNRAAPGDTVLFAGMGHERSRIIGGNSFDFNEENIIRHAVCTKETWEKK